MSRDKLDPAAELTYGSKVQALFTELRHGGFVAASAAADDAPLTTAAGSIEQGAHVRWQVWLREGHIVEARYQAYGCPHFLTACESLARWLSGKSLTEVMLWPWGELAQDLSFPDSKRNKLLILQDALQRLTDQAPR